MCKKTDSLLPSAYRGQEKIISCPALGTRNKPCAAGRQSTQCLHQWHRSPSLRPPNNGCGLWSQGWAGGHGLVNQGCISIGDVFSYYTCAEHRQQKAVPETSPGPRTQAPGSNACLLEDPRSRTGYCYPHPYPTLALGLRRPSSANPHKPCTSLTAPKSASPCGGFVMLRVPWPW